MSTLRVTNVQDTAGANSLTTAQIYNGAAKAWVNFDGTFGTSPFTTGNGGIRASFNVISITDNGTGDYTITFTNAMVDANYALTGSASGLTTNLLCVVAADGTTARTSIAARIVTTFLNSNPAFDVSVVSVAVFR